MRGADAIPDGSDCSQAAKCEVAVGRARVVRDRDHDEGKNPLQILVTVEGSVKSDRSSHLPERGTACATAIGGWILVRHSFPRDGRCVDELFCPKWRRRKGPGKFVYAPLTHPPTTGDEPPPRTAILAVRRTPASGQLRLIPSTG